MRRNVERTYYDIDGSSPLALSTAHRKQSMMKFVVAYLTVVVVMSVVCFVSYGLDKRKAATGGQRVPERTLHVLAFLGGWPGGLLGQRRFRHKTKKIPFRIVFWALVFLHVVIVGAVAYAIFNGPHGEAGGRSQPIGKE